MNHNGTITLTDEQLITELRKAHDKYRNRWLGSPELVKIGLLCWDAAKRLEAKQTELNTYKTAMQNWHEEAHDEA